MKYRSTNRLLFGFVLIAAFIAAVAMMSGDGSAQAEFPEEFLFEEEMPAPIEEEEPVMAPDALHVGTYDPDAAFQRHPAQQALEMALRTAQTEMQRAQQEGDQMAMQQVQQQYEHSANMAIQEFQQDVDRVLPEVAEDTGVKVVATDVVYTADNVHTSDITPELIEAMTDGLEEPFEEPAMPDFPGPQY